MLDDRQTTEGDLVHDGNISQWKQQFCDETGYSMECVDETVTDMANLIAKTCVAFGDVPIDEILERIGVEEFDKHIRAILKTKDCDCNE